MIFIKLIKPIIPLLILISIGFFLWRGLAINPTLVPSALIDKQIPEFNLRNLISPQQTLSKQIFLGHVSLLNVWATWCTVCANEYPVLIDIKNTHLVTIYGLDYKDDRQTALRWIKKYGNPFAKIGFDPEGTTAINWGVYGTPETFVIDKKGIIRYKVIGEVSHRIWQRILLPLIEKLQREST